MAFNVIISYPWWFIAFCLLTGALYALVLYRKENRLEDTSGWVVWLLGGLRFTCVTLLSFLLLSPLVKTISRQTEKPVVVIAQDNSQSILFNKDSSFYKNEYKAQIEKLSNELGEKYNVQTYSFGTEVKNNLDFSYNQKETDLSSVFSEIENRFTNRNLGAVIIASDGLYNKGSNPLYSSNALHAPVYTVALGDTTVKKDVILSNVLHNSIAYLGNNFPLQAVIDAYQLKDKSSILTVTKGSTTLFTQKVDIAHNSFNTNIMVRLDANESGIQHYKIKLSLVDGETNTANNERDIFINVLDSRQKILILANAPHPDIAALKHTLEGNQNYEVEAALISDFNKSIKSFNLVILHQLSSTNNNAGIIFSEIKTSSTPVLSIAGSLSDLPAGLRISQAINKTNDSEASLVENFNLFTLSDELRAYVKNLPALTCPFGSYQINPSVQVLFNQKIGMVNTQNPLIAFNQINENKTGVITGEGIWRWKLRDYADHGNHDIFNELIYKTVQYLSVKDDKSFFRVAGKNNFLENEIIEFDAEVYNQTYELINEPEVSMIISDAEGKKFPFTFSKTANAYRLNAGSFSVGEYNYEARVKTGEKINVQKGSFSVSPVVVESINTIANHQLLYSLAKKHGAEMVYPNELQKLSDAILSREDIKTVSYTQQKLTDLIQFKYIFFVLLLLLSTEWFIRKRNGAY